ICFCISRFIFTWLMKFFAPSRLMKWDSWGALIATVLVIFTSGMGWLPIIALIVISVFMSLMFPTIYGIALEDVGNDTKIGASGLIMAIFGGAVITPVQGMVSDKFGVNISYIVPLICFIVILAFSVYADKQRKAVTAA
ncbi:MAG: MFS transporter, partial [Bacteroidaceae bacterium]|nr:MFS transporter [Bacteroidaceae bacterium]